MASSRYTAYIGYAKDLYNLRPLNESWDLRTIPDSDKLEHKTSGGGYNLFVPKLRELVSTFKDSSEKYLLINIGSHTCRESLLDYTAEVMRSGRHVNTPGMTQQTLHIFYEKQGGELLTKNHREKMLKFGKLFFHGFTKYEISEFDYGICLFHRVDSSYFAKHLWLISLFLWIFRNQQILDNILNKFTKPTEIAELYDYLSREFLLHDDWDDYANSSLCMSMLCFLETKGLDFPLQYQAWFDGPTNAMQRIMPLGALIFYMKNCFIPVIGRPEDIFHNTNTGALVSDFQNSFTQLYDLIIAEQELEEIHKKKASRKAKREQG